MENETKKLTRPDPSSSPCLAVLGRYPANLRLVSLNGETSDVHKMSFGLCHDIVTVGGQVYALGDENIWKINSNGNITFAIKLDGCSLYSARAVSFKDKVYVIRPRGIRMIRFDPTDKTTNYDLPRCKLGSGLCCCASDKFIYAMGGDGTDTSAMKYDPLTNRWTDIAPMKHEKWHSAAAAWNNRIYVLGGGDNPPPEFYDPQTSTWNEISKMNVRRMRFSAHVINNQLYAVGGGWDEDWEKFEQRESVEVFDGDRWKVVTKFGFEYNKSGVYACTWPHGSAQPASAEQLSKEVDEEIKDILTKQRPTMSESVGSKGGKIKLPKVSTKVPEGALKGNDKVSYPDLRD